MKFLFVLLAALCPFLASADLYNTTIQVTGTPADGNTIVINSTTRTWKSTVTVPSTQMLIGGSLNASATNLYIQLAGNAIPGVHVSMAAADKIKVQATSLAVSQSGTWATIAILSTNIETPTTVFRVPLSAEPTPAMATNIASLAIQGLNDYGTNSFHENAIAMQNMVGLTNDQTIAGSKQFTNALGQWFGIVSNSPAISGNIDKLTNGLLRTPKFISPISSNLVNYGNPISSPSGTAVFAEQFGSAASAGNVGALAVGRSATATGASSEAIGNGANTSADNSLAVGTGSLILSTHTGSTALGYGAATTAANQNMIGSSTSYTHIPGNLRIDGNTELTWDRFALTSLANGNNAGIVVGTNTFVEVSGPSGAFSINGIAGGRDGKLLIILNQTGQNMTIAHDSGTDPTAANRIYSMTGADRVTTGNGAATLIYSGAASRWILTTFEQ